MLVDSSAVYYQGPSDFNVTKRRRRFDLAQRILGPNPSPLSARLRSIESISCKVEKPKRKPQAAYSKKAKQPKKQKRSH